MYQIGINTHQIKKTHVDDFDSLVLELITSSDKI